LVLCRYINPVGLKHLTPSWKFYTIYCCWIAVELCVVYFFYVETRGPTLEEIAKIFDGDSAETGVADISEVKADMTNVDAEKTGSTAIHVESVGRSHNRSVDERNMF
jgi:hypothetical protein